MWPAVAVANEGLAHPLFVLEEKHQAASPPLPASLMQKECPSFYHGLYRDFRELPRKPEGCIR